MKYSMRIAAFFLLIFFGFASYAQVTETEVEEIYEKLDKIEKAKSNKAKITPVSPGKSKVKIPSESKELDTQRVPDEVALRILGLDSTEQIVDSHAVNSIAAEISFDTMTVNAGTITQGETYSRTFVFKNTGTADLELFDVVPDCSCTSPEFTKGTFSPGETGKIVVAYDSKEDIGDFLKTITVLHSAGEGFSFLEIRGFVSPKL